MKRLTRLILIGVMAGIILAGFLRFVQLFTGNPAYILLFNMEYIPVLERWNDMYGAGMAFHFATCIASVVVWFYFLEIFRMEKKFLPYFLTYTIGGGVLFTLTGLTNIPPAIENLSAWMYWTSGHGVFGVAVGVLVKIWG